MSGAEKRLMKPFSAGHAQFSETDKNKRKRVYAQQQRDRHKYVHPVAEYMDLKYTHISAQFTKRRTFLFIILLLWVTAVWSTIIYKHATEKWEDIFKYFTNVTLFLQVTFYTCYLFVFFEDPSKRKLETFLLVWIFWLVFAQVLIVFILVIGVMYDAPELITANMKSFGGSFDDGVVLAANSLFHVIPAIVAFVFLFITWGDIAECLVIQFGYYKIAPDNQMTEEEDVPMYPAFALNVAVGLKDQLLFVKIDRCILYLYTVCQYFFSSMPFVMYMLVVDLHKQYGVSENLSTWVPVVAVFFINLFIVCAPTLFMFFSTIPSKFILKSQIDELEPQDVYIVEDMSGSRRIYADAQTIHPWPT